MPELSMQDYNDTGSSNGHLSTSNTTSDQTQCQTHNFRVTGKSGPLK